MHLIVVPLYDHTSDAEVDEILRDLRGIGLDDCYSTRLPDDSREAQTLRGKSRAALGRLTNWNR